MPMPERNHLDAPVGDLSRFGSDISSVTVSEVESSYDGASLSGVSIGNLSEHSLHLNANAGNGKPNDPDDSDLRFLWAVKIGNPVLSVAVSPDGTWCFFGCSSGKAIVQDLAADQQELCHVEHAKPVLSVAVSPTGQLLATGSDDRTAALWKLTHESSEVRCESLLRLQHDATVFAVAFSSDSSKVATGSWFYNVKLASIWDASSGSLLRKVEHGAGVLTLDLSPCDTWLATGSYDRRLNLWHMPSLLAGDSSSATSSGPELLSDGPCCRTLKFSPDGSKLAAGFESGKVSVWLVVNDSNFNNDSNSNNPTADVVPAIGNNFKPLCNFHHDEGVFALAFSPDSMLVLTATLPLVGGSVLSVWDAFLDMKYFERTLHCGVLALAVTPDAQLVITGSNDKTLSVWNLSAQLTSCVVTM